jgi:2-haloacid dehalogenase
VDRAQAFVFDAYGTRFGVHAVVTALQAVTPEAQAVSRRWQVKQLDYSWLRSVMEGCVDFWTVTEKAL